MKEYLHYFALKTRKLHKTLLLSNAIPIYLYFDFLDYFSSTKNNDFKIKTT